MQGFITFILIVICLYVLAKHLAKPKDCSKCNPESCLGFKTLKTVKKDGTIECGFIDSCKIVRKENEHN